MEGSRKNWLKPAEVSLAKLNRIQASLHTRKIKDANMYKPPSSMHTLPGQHKSELSHGKEHLGKSEMYSHRLHEDKTNFKACELRSPSLESLLHPWGSSDAVSKLIQSQEKLARIRSCSTKTQTRVMPGSASRVKTFSATETRQLAALKFSAEVQSIYSDVGTAKKTSNKKKVSPGSWGNNSSYSVIGERVRSLDKQITPRSIDSSTSYLVVDQCVTPQLGVDNLAELDRPCWFVASSDKDDEKPLSTSELQHQLSPVLPIHVCLPIAYSDSGDGDDELDNDSSSPHEDEYIKERVKKDGCGVKNTQVVRSVVSDPIEDFDKYRNTRNISCQRNIQSKRIETVQSSISEAEDKKNKKQNKMSRLNSRGFLNDADRSGIATKLTSALREQMYDSGTSDDFSDNYLGQLEVTSQSKITNELNAEDSSLHRQSVTADNFTESPPLLESHTAESGVRTHSDPPHRKLFLLSQKVLKTYDKAGFEADGDSAIAKKFPDCFSATDVVNTQGEKVESDTDIKLDDVEVRDQTVDLIEGQQCPRNLADSKSDMLLPTSVNIRDNRNVKGEIIPRNTQRKLRKKITCSSNTNTQTILADVHCEIESSSEYGDSKCEPAAAVGSSDKKYGNHILNSDTGLSNTGMITKSHSKHSHRSIPVVTIDYGNNEGKKELKPNYLTNKVNNMEVKTSELAEPNIIPCFLLTMFKSSRERNYYDIAHCPTTGKVLEECVDKPEKKNKPQDKNKLLKTTKTIEFTPQAPEEVVSKNIIQPLNESKPLPKEDLNHKPQIFCLQVYEPVRIKKPRNRISSAPKERSEWFFDRSKTASVTDLSRSRQMASIQRQKNKPKKNIKDIADKEKVSSATTYSRGTRIASAPSRSLKQERTVRDSVAEEIQVIRSKMASLDANDGVKALEKALFTTSGRMVHSHAANYLPSDPSYGLIPHYKHWLPEEYIMLQTIKKKLAEDDRCKHLRSLRAAKKMKKLTVGDVAKIIRKT